LPLKTINRHCLLQHGFTKQCKNATLIKDLGCKVRPPAAAAACCCLLLPAAACCCLVDQVHAQQSR
jgi:hypothetical protein